MIILKQNYKNENNEVIFEQIHIYSENGYFYKNNKKTGWHIAIGTTDSADKYEERIEPGTFHSVPESLPDVVVIDLPTDEEIPAEEALKELQEVIENEEI